MWQQRLEKKVSDWLDEGEDIKDIGSAQSVEFAESVGGHRGAGEGVLAVTSWRLLFRDDATKRGIIIPLQDVKKSWSTWNIAPGMRTLHVKTNGPAFEFYVGKHFAREMEEILSNPEVRRTAAQAQAESPTGESVRGRCLPQKLLLTEPDYEPMTICVDKEGVVLFGSAGGSLRIGWDTVTSVSPDERGWFLKLDQGEENAPGFYGLLIYEIDDDERLTRIIEDHGPGMSRVEPE